VATISLRPAYLFRNLCDRPVFVVPVDAAEDSWLCERPTRVDAGHTLPVFWPDGCRLALAMRPDRADADNLPVFRSASDRARASAHASPGTAQPGLEHHLRRAAARRARLPRRVRH
jgi:hypothetical protein